MSSNKRNSIFSGVVPVMGAAQTIIPLPTGSKVLSESISTALADTNPIARHSTGSALLDSFIGDGVNEAFALQTELTSLSLELKRIQNPKFKRATASTREAHHAKGRMNGHRRTDRGADGQAESALRARLERAAKGLPADRPRITENNTRRPDAGAVGRAMNRAVDSARLQRSPTPVKRLSSDTQRPEAKIGSDTQRPDELGANALPQQSTPRVRVYGGSDYKALQAKAEAGGLVNLDDSLLFGGADQDVSKPSAGAQSLESSFDAYLSERLEDFTASPIKGGFHPTAHLAAAKDSHQFYRDAWCKTVLGSATFKLGDLSDRTPSSENEHRLNSQRDATSASNREHPVELNDLGRQVTYLNQRIEYLSRRLAELADGDVEGVTEDPRQKANAHMNNGHALTNSHKASQHKMRSPVVIGLESFDVSDVEEVRVATLDTLPTAL